MEGAKNELRMPAHEFDRIMRRALQAPPQIKRPKAARAWKKMRSGSAKRSQK
jgi:hypothetical protein